MKFSWPGHGGGCPRSRYTPPTDAKKKRGLVRESRLRGLLDTNRDGERDAATEKSSSDFLNGEMLEIHSPSRSEERDFRRESGTHKRYLLHLVNVTNVDVSHSLFVSLFRGFAKENSQGRNGVV